MVAIKEQTNSVLESLKSFKIGELLKLCVNPNGEQQVGDVYKEGFSFYFPEKVLEYPNGCDGYITTQLPNSSYILKMVIEYKYDKTNNVSDNLNVYNARILIQVIFYLHLFEKSGIPLPSVAFVGTNKECFVIHVNSLLKYLDYDLDWNIAPSSAYSIYPEVVLDISKDPLINPFIFDVNDHFDFKDVIFSIYNLCDTVKRYIHVTEHNIREIYERFLRVINSKSKQSLSSNDLVCSFIGVLTDGDSYYLHPKKKNILVTPNGNISINGDAFISFFTLYSREYSPKEKMKLTSILDRLLEDTTRRRQGAFYTPTIFVDFAHRMIEKELGDDWRDKYVVWDSAAGSLNLTRDYYFKELYCSTLEQSELDLGSRYNPEATKWQMDFLNDCDEKIDKGLIKAFKENKPIVFFINPPYGTAAVNGSTGTSRAGTNNTAIRYEMNKIMFGGSENLQHQFMYRITKIVQKYRLTNVYFALFSKPIWLSGAKQGKFLKNFSSQWECKDAYLFQASHFADVSDAWGIILTLWKSNNQATPITEYNMKLIDILDDGSIDVFGHHTIYNSAFFYKASDWVKEPIKFLKEKKTFPCLTSGLKLDILGRERTEFSKMLGCLTLKGNNVKENSTGVLWLTSTYANGHCACACAENFTRCTALFTARKLIEGNWINDKDEYLAPNENHPDYKRFETDSIVYSLFHNSSNQTSMRQITYKGKLYDIPNEFFWMSKDTMMNLANENHDDFMFNDARTSKERYVFTLLQNFEIEQHLSETAKQLLSMATDMVINSMKYRILFESDHPDHHIHTWDCGYYQLKNLWKEYLPDDFKKFRDLYKQFGNELRPLVYELGFLRK